MLSDHKWQQSSFSLSAKRLVFHLLGNVIIFCAWHPRRTTEVFSN